jgi:hypothetical protein
MEQIEPCTRYSSHSEKGVPGKSGYVRWVPVCRLGSQNTDHFFLCGVLLSHQSLNKVQELREVDASGTISIVVIEGTLNFMRAQAPAC